MTTLAERLRVVMKEQGWTQQALAQSVGVTQAAIGGWLAGSIPYPRHLASLSIATGIRRDWLLYGTGRKMMRPPVVYPEVKTLENESETFAKKVTSLRREASPALRELLDAFVDALEKTVRRHQQQAVPLAAEEPTDAYGKSEPTVEHPPKNEPPRIGFRGESKDNPGHNPGRHPRPAKLFHKTYPLDSRDKIPPRKSVKPADLAARG